MMSDKASFDILGLGCVAVDDILYIKKYPPADSKVPVLRRKREVGGLAARALLAASGLGARCAYSAILGSDDLSEYVLSTFRLAGIDIESVKKKHEAGPMHTVAIVADEQPTRNTFFDDSRWQGMPPNWPPNSLICSARVLLLDDYIGLPAAIRATEIARGASIPVVADLEADHSCSNALFDLIDHLIISQSFAEKVTNETEPVMALGKLWSRNRVFLAITAGQNGCWYRCAEEVTVHHEPAFRVPVVDTTGCGDVFHGAYAWALAQKRSSIERVQIASAAAALKAQGKMPLMKTVIALLEHAQYENV